MYFQLLRWECISYHSMQCAADTPTVSVGIIMQCAANAVCCKYSYCFGGNHQLATAMECFARPELLPILHNPNLAADCQKTISFRY